jgi:hypothetical protein
MPTPSVPYRVLFEPIPEFSGQGGTLSATATFEVSWQYRGQFIRDALGLPTASTGWPTPQVPWEYPFETGIGLYATSFRCVPHTVQDNIATTDNTLDGHFTYAHVTLGFQTPQYDISLFEPTRQIDPVNPILFCEQSIETQARTIPIEGYQLQYVGAPASVVPIGPKFMIETQADIILNFPFVPYIPWDRLEPYIGKSNSATLFNRPAETIVFLGASMRNETFVDGTSRCSCVLRLGYNATGWNKQLGTDGNLYTVVVKGTGEKLYPTANLAAIWS